MLVLEGLRKRYGANLALDGLSLSVRRGEIFGLLGPNGAGKTTTVSLAVGLLAPDEGTVTVAGQGEPSSPAVRSRLGLAPQALALYDGLSGYENVAFFGSVYGLAGPRLGERVSAAIEFVGLAERRRDRVSTYSGGMKRRLNLAVALVHDPELILLDEPTVGVDPQSRNLIFENVRHLREAGKTIVYTTHYMEEAELLAAHGGPPVLVEVQRANLEQVFLRLTGRQLRD